METPSEFDPYRAPLEGPPVDVISVASSKDNTAPGASGEVKDHQEHHRDDQEQLQDHFYVVFIRFFGGYEG